MKQLINTALFICAIALSACAPNEDSSSISQADSNYCTAQFVDDVNNIAHYVKLYYATGQKDEDYLETANNYCEVFKKRYGNNQSCVAELNGKDESVNTKTYYDGCDSIYKMLNSL